MNCVEYFMYYIVFVDKCWLIAKFLEEVSSVFDWKRKIYQIFC